MLNFTSGSSPASKEYQQAYDGVMETMMNTNGSNQEYAATLTPQKRDEFLALKRAEARQLAAFAERRHHKQREPYEPFLGDKQPKSRPLMELEDGDEDEDRYAGRTYSAGGGSGGNAVKLVVSSRKGRDDDAKKSEKKMKKRAKDTSAEDEPRSLKATPSSKRPPAPPSTGNSNNALTNLEMMSNAYANAESGVDSTSSPNSMHRGRRSSTQKMPTTPYGSAPGKAARKAQLQSQTTYSDDEGADANSGQRRVNFVKGSEASGVGGDSKSKSKKKKNDGQGKKPCSDASASEDDEPESQGFAPYEARPGEERLAESIAGEMTLPQSYNWEGAAMPNQKARLTWDDIGGLEHAKQTLLETITLPVAFPMLFKGSRSPASGLLLFGPPGTGKTMLAKAVASQSGTAFFNMSPASLVSKWRGEGEKLIRIVFEMARHYAPSVVFIDEVDALTGDRGSSGEHEASRRSKTELLAQIDGMASLQDPGKPVVVLGATNTPWDVDPAFRRRFSRRLMIPLPEEEERASLFKLYTKDLTLGNDLDMLKLSKLCQGKNYSAHDVHSVVREAAMLPIRRVSAKFHQEQSASSGAPTAGGGSTSAGGGGDRKIGMNGVVMQGLVRVHQQYKDSPAELLRIQAELMEEPCRMQDFVEAIQRTPSSVDLKQVAQHEKWAKEFACV